MILTAPLAARHQTWGQMKLIKYIPLLLALVSVDAYGAAAYHDSAGNSYSTGFSIDVDSPNGDEVLIVFAGEEVGGPTTEVQTYSATVGGNAMTFLGVAQESTLTHIEVYCRKVDDLSGSQTVTISGWAGTSERSIGIIVDGVDDCTAFDNDETETATGSTTTTPMNVEADGINVCGVLESHNSTMTWSGGNINAASRVSTGDANGTLSASTAEETTLQTQTNYVSTATNSGRSRAQICVSLSPAATGSTTTWADVTVDPDGSQNISGTLDVAFTNPITKLVCANGDEHTTTTGTPTTSSATFTITPATTWTATGSLNNTDLNAATSCYLANASETSTGDDITFNLMQSGNGWAIESNCDSDGTPNPCPTDSLFLDGDWTTTVNTGDAVLLSVNSGIINGFSSGGVVSAPNNGLPVNADVYTFDSQAATPIWRTSSSLAISPAECTTSLVHSVVQPVVESVVFTSICQ